MREIPYNYTSLTDEGIVSRLLGKKVWQWLLQLQNERKTGRSARMLFEVLGDIWVVLRNPYLQEDLLSNKKRLALLVEALHHRLQSIESRRAVNNANNHLVGLVLEEAYLAVKKFEDFFLEFVSLRKKAVSSLAKIAAKNNILTDPFSRVSHVTDASDWRIEYPLLVLAPDSPEEAQRMVQTCIKLGLTMVPRGGGTGYTGGAIPLTWKSVVINTEKWLDVSGVSCIQLKHLHKEPSKAFTISTQAGVVTQTVSEMAKSQGLVFAVDPTSASASCIGGNIAMNAGGKKAVLWGTAVDNLYSWRMINPQGLWLEVTRLDHNLGKIHEEDWAHFELCYFQPNGTTLLDRKILSIPGKEFRKVGLGKDVSDKFLGGLPGVQKEGTDGLIVSATWVLHTYPQNTRTVCLEFFGNYHTSVLGLVAIKQLFDEQVVQLTGFEHLDKRYLRAVGYATKSPSAELPNMLLLLDLSGPDLSLVAKLASECVRLANLHGGQGFVAVQESIQKKFWEDR
ncbi:MAG: DUF3683 domain-containing protein, partial [Gammaproteobacteria bacterium]|nr:DUF3683 domain-containing protein [Gammaproteobacteria bacterium]